MSVLDDIVRSYGMLCQYYTMLYVYNVRRSRRMRYSDVQYDIRYCLLVFPGAVGTGH
jgi:hypothetical protein